MSEVKKGFSAYPEINALAQRAFNATGQDVAVRAEIFGDRYEVLIDHKIVIKGSTAEVRAKLYQALSLVDKEVK